MQKFTNQSLSSRPSSSLGPLFGAASSSSSSTSRAGAGGLGAKVIDGKAIAKNIRADLAAEAEDLKSSSGIIPSLAVVLVGERKDSATYVRMKARAAKECGIHSSTVNLPDTVSQAELEATVEALNADGSIHGILVQLPLPDGINESAVLDKISAEKDVDGLAPSNQGSLMMRGREPLFNPCTPAGCIELLDRSGVQIAGARAVVLGRSNIVGNPVAQLLQNRNATVTVCHSKTKDVASIVRQADIVIAAMGRPGSVKAEWIKPGAAVIDVATNAVDDPGSKRGYKLVGDADAAVADVAGWITPVPGGVGPMTIAMLMKNTLISAKRAAAQASAGNN